ncbi:MAG: arsenate reductase family protein [Bdellovibrionota bacterium]
MNRPFAVYKAISFEYGILRIFGMSEKIIVYQKPTCSKCRATLTLLNESGEEFEAINYYETLLTAEKLKELVGKLGVTLQDIVRKDESVAQDLDVMSMSDDELAGTMVKNPDLIQRPIVVRGDKAVLCRPPENVHALL